MTDKQLNAYAKRFKNFNDEERTQIAKIIADTFKEDTSKEEQENIYSNQCMQTIKNIISLSNYQKDEEKNKDLIERFSKLSYKNQMCVINSMSKRIKAIEKNEEEKARKKQCKEEGHIFSNWTKHQYSRSIPNPYRYSRDYVYSGPGEMPDYISEDFNVWERKCERCGFVEQVEKEPKELVKERKAQEKKEKIKQLKMELRKLEKE